MTIIAALAGRDLLVGVEGENAVIAQRARQPPFVLCAQSLAGIFDHLQPVLLGSFEDGVHVRRLPKHIHRQDGFQLPPGVPSPWRGSHLPGSSTAPAQIVSGGLSTRPGSILPVWGSTSTKTGTARSKSSTLREATKEKGVVITRSPSAPMPAARTHRCSPAVPELTPMACLLPV